MDPNGYSNGDAATDCDFEADGGRWGQKQMSAVEDGKRENWSYIYARDRAIGDQFGALSISSCLSH